MRLWHYKLIPVLPRAQLLAQWRECNAIAKDIRETGKTNHILINRIMNHDLEDFRSYCELIYEELVRRGYVVKNIVLKRLCEYVGVDFAKPVANRKPFSTWHTDRYLRQCYYNLEEKHDCGGISDTEWFRIDTIFKETIDFKNVAK